MKKLIAFCLALMLLCGCAAPEQTAAPTEVPPTQSATEDTSEPSAVVTQTGFGMTYLPEYGFNPYTCAATLNRAFLSLLYESLFVVSNEYRAEPVLCDSFTASEDGSVYRYTIFSDIFFSDGTAMTSADVVASLNAARDSDYYRKRLRHISSVEADGAYTVVITLDTAYENFSLMMDVPIVKADTVESSNPTGSGTYHLAGTVLRKNSYWRQTLAPIIDEEAIRLYTASDPTGIRDDFEFGGTDLVYCDPNSPAAINYRCDYEVWEVPTTVLHYLGFNLYSGYFPIRELRTAVTRVIDREALTADVYGGFAIPTVLPCSPLSDLYDTSLAASCTYSPEALKAAVHNSGILSTEEYANHVGILLVCSEDPTRVAAAEAIAQALCDAGLNIKVNAVVRDEYELALSEGDFDLYYGEVRLTANFDLSVFFDSYGALRYGSISDAGLSTLCTAALGNSGSYVELCKELLDSAPICPVVFKSYAVYVTRGKISNLTPAVDWVFHNSLNARSLSDADRSFVKEPDDSPTPTDTAE